MNSKQDGSRRLFEMKEAEPEAESPFLDEAAYDLPTGEETRASYGTEPQLQSETPFASALATKHEYAGRAAEQLDVLAREVQGFEYDEPSDAATEETADELLEEGNLRELELEKKAASASGSATILIVDQHDRPLGREWYVARQGSLTDQGVVEGGRAELYRVDTAQPFSFEVKGRVVAIKEGAVLLWNAPGVEYGGTFIDWELADGEKADSVFWPQYEQLRRGRRDGIARFWQHEYITRRLIRARTGYAGRGGRKLLTLQAGPLQIRTGPLVRFTSHERAVIWVELETPGLVRVSYAKVQQAVTPRKLASRLAEEGLLRRHATTVRVGGRHFGVVALDGLQANALYRYTLELAPLPAGAPLPVEEEEFKDTFFSLSSRAAKDAVEKQLHPASLRGDKWLFFRALAQRYETLRFAHGSCRKWPGDTGEGGRSPGSDMLDALGELWLPSLASLAEWPAFILHTGDQIYADDIGIKQGEAIARDRFGARIPGPKDDRDELVGGAWSGRFGHRFLAVSAERLKAMGDIQPLEERERRLNSEAYRGLDRMHKERSSMSKELRDTLMELAEARAQLEVARRRNLPANYVTDPKLMRFKYQVTNHLLWRVPIGEKNLPDVKPHKLQGSAGEFYAPAGELRGIHAADFAEFSYLYEKAWTTPHVRKIFANIPSFMIFDDHEITDDWNLSEDWRKRVFTKKDPYQYWPKTITDGIIAYWLYQGWGNLSPLVWKDRKLCKILLKARQTGRDALPELRQTGFTEAARVPGDLIFHYRLPITSPKFLVTDMRTRRTLKPDDKSSAFDDKQLAWLKENLKTSENREAVFVVMSLPFLVPRFMSFAMSHPRFLARVKSIMENIRKAPWNWDAVEVKEIVRDMDMEHPVRDATWTQMSNLLADLQNSVTNLKSVVLLSGDVHMSFNVRANLRENGREVPPELLQLVSSGSRNAPSGDDRRLVRRFLSWFATDHKFRKLHIEPAGFEGVRGKTETVLFQPSIALVNILTKDGKVELHEQYFTRDIGAQRLKTWDFWYRKSATAQYITPVSKK
jgi:hypothetical protein